MKKHAVVLVVVGVFVLSFAVGIFASGLAWEDISKGNLNLKTVLVDPDNPNTIYIGSKNAILKTDNGGEFYRSILFINGQSSAVNFLCIDMKDKNRLYAATENGLYFTANLGRTWRRLFRGKNYLERQTTVVVPLPDKILLGTNAGLFLSKDKGRTWHKLKGIVGENQILSIAYNEKEAKNIYVATVIGVFKSQDAGDSWKRVFVDYATENEVSDDQGEDNNPDEQEQNSFIRYITIDPNNLNYLYLATSKGIYQSQDKAETWQIMPDYGLLSTDIRFLLVSSQSDIYAVTKSGIFKYNKERWQEISLGMLAQDIRFLASDSQGNLYAASEQGLFKANIKDFSRDRQYSISNLYYEDEPEVTKIHQAAIRYAEVEPEKIARWRKQAAKRALLPKVTIDMDRDMDRTASNSIWGTYSSNTTPGRYFVGPDDVTKYNNKNWGVSLTWELGDLIFSDDQTNIDVRSRLMVQLRNDILDEVTKIYFERLRVKMELDALSIEERKKRMEKELRLQELTAYLDALTGGYFSRTLEEYK